MNRTRRLRGWEAAVRPAASARRSMARGQRPCLRAVSVGRRPRRAPASTAGATPASRGPGWRRRAARAVGVSSADALLGLSRPAEAEGVTDADWQEAASELYFQARAELALWAED